MNNDKINKIMQTIKNEKSLEDYFFKKLSVANKPLEWLIPLKEEGYFDPKKTPQPVKIAGKETYYKVPHWNALDALVNMTIKNSDQPPEKYSKLLSEIIDGIIDHKINSDIPPNYRTNWKLLQAISYLPIKYIGIKHIRFIEDSLSTKFGGTLVETEIGELFLPKLIRAKSKQLIIELLEVILNYRKPDGVHIHQYISVMDHYYLRKTISDNKEGIAEICAYEAAQVAIGKMRNILYEKITNFSIIWIPAIEDHEQTEFPDKYECQIVHFARDMLKVANPNEIKPLLKELLNEEHPIFKRLAYNTINHKYDFLSDLFWDIDFNPINRDVFHELFRLFKLRCKGFSSEQINKVITWIETQEIKISRAVIGNKEKEEQAKAYVKKRWLHAMLDTGNSKIRQMYEEYNLIDDTEIIHPDFYVYQPKGGYIKEVSPIPDEEFKKMTSNEKVEFINNYKPDKTINWDNLTEVNLASSLRRIVSEVPGSFTSDIEPFIKIPREYQYELLRGFQEAWKNKKQFDWNELFKFINQLFGDKSLWEEKGRPNYDYNSWIIDIVASLLQEGTQDDKNAFPPKLMLAAEEIIINLLDKVKSDMIDLKDIVTSVLNSTKGKVYIAAISYSLRYARLKESGKDSKWKHSIKSEFTKRLDKTIEPGLEFSYILGGHINQLSYLDQQWVQENINNIFDMEHTKHWESAFIGYLAMNTTLYEDIYKLIRENGHYDYGLSRSYNDNYLIQKLVQNIVIGYVAGWDNLDDPTSLIHKMIEIDSPNYLLETTTFVSSLRNKDVEKYKHKVKPLWALIIKVVKQKSNIEPYREIAANLGNWLSLVDEIDSEVYEWLEITSKAFDEQWKAGFFIEYLLRHIEKTPDKVGNLFLTMISSGFYPDYRKEDIIQIVQKLYEFGEKEIADRICNNYLSNGSGLLRETYDIYNPSKAT